MFSIQNLTFVGIIDQMHTNIRPDCTSKFKYFTLKIKNEILI